MEKDLKILEELIEFLKRNDFEDFYGDATEEIQAIRKLIRVYEDLEEKVAWKSKEMKRLEKEICYLQDQLYLYKKDLGEFYKSSEEQLKNYIPKSKIEEKIKELEIKKKKYRLGSFGSILLLNMICVLQNLLESEENKNGK